jgi:phenylpropionate dioxygenase-like ring-hydroxylating dioxygenase large terminal subunit
MERSVILEAIARQRSGWSLEQLFYTDPEFYAFERRHWLAKQWYTLAHGSELPEVGSFIVRDLLGESLIILRDSERVVRAYYNVCRHRGSRICKADGKASSLVCPYHAWSYRLDGSLRSAAAMSPDISLIDLALHPAPVLEVGGVILGSLQGDASGLDRVQAASEPMLQYHAIPNARIAARRSYPTSANWKLVMENFTECYHCYPAHPEYCSTMKHVEVLARKASPEAIELYEQEVQRWFQKQADPDSPAAARKSAYADAMHQPISRTPIGGGRLTQSQDGKPVAPLMGQQKKFDGGMGVFSIRPFSFLALLNDHAVMFQFLPSGPERTDVHISWLVDSAARAEEVDVERMVWLWDVTTVQDKAIVELNAQGVRSCAYQPGPYSMLETGPTALLQGYLRELAAACAA